MSAHRPAHLWECEHPYYATEGNYYHGSSHVDSASWDAFEEMMGAADIDLNHVWRWDWHIDEDGTHRLQVFFMGQRKAYCFSHSIAVTPDDEPRVMVYLNRHWLRLQEMWAPFHADSQDVVDSMAEEWRQAKIARLRAELAELGEVPE